MFKHKNHDLQVRMKEWQYLNFSILFLVRSRFWLFSLHRTGGHLIIPTIIHFLPFWSSGSCWFIILTHLSLHSSPISSLNVLPIPTLTLTISFQIYLWENIFLISLQSHSTFSASNKTTTDLQTVQYSYHNYNHNHDNGGTIQWGKHVQETQVATNSTINVGL